MPTVSFDPVDTSSGVSTTVVILWFPQKAIADSKEFAAIRTRHKTGARRPRLAPTAPTRRTPPPPPPVPADDDAPAASPVSAAAPSQPHVAFTRVCTVGQILLRDESSLSVLLDSAALEGSNHLECRRWRLEMPTRRAVLRTRPRPPPWKGFPPDRLPSVADSTRLWLLHQRRTKRLYGLGLPKRGTVCRRHNTHQEKRTTTQNTVPA